MSLVINNYTMMSKRKVLAHFDAISADYDWWKARSSYYYTSLICIYREFHPHGLHGGGKILEIGCGTGTILSHMNPNFGLGIDISSKMISIASKKFKNLRFLVGDAECLPINFPFDYVIIPDVVEHLCNVRRAIRELHKVSNHHTRIVLTCANPIYEPVMNLAERFGLKMPEGDHNRITIHKLLEIIEEEGFLVCYFCGRVLLPKYIPYISDNLNKLARETKLLRSFCWVQVIGFRPVRGTQ